MANQEYLIDNWSLSAEERFEKFRKKHPSLLKKSLKKQITSIIGVTLELFSKMRVRPVRKA